MTKKAIHQALLRQLSQELETIQSAARASFATATSDAHHAEGKYDTFSLETSYLARGQAKRVAELRDALERLQLIALKPLTPDDPVQLGALVRLETEAGNQRLLFFGSAAGGETITADGEEIVIVTAQSPLGRAVLGKIVGERFDIRIAGQQQTFTLIAVE